MKPKAPPIDTVKALIACGVILGSAASAWLFQPRYHANADALASLVSIFSVLAGFLAAIIALVANDRALKGRTWREDTYYLEQVRRELSKHQFLFYLYLATLAMAFVCQLGSSTDWPFQAWIERLLLFLATLAMMMSFSLPVRLTKRQMEDLEKVISERRQKQTGNKQ